MNARSLILHRVLLISVGLAAALFFNGWGMAGFFVFVVLYCRLLANHRGFYYFPDGLDIEAGNPYSIALLISLGLTALGVVTVYFSENKLTPIFDYLHSLSMIEFKPSCSTSSNFSNFDGLHNCDTFYRSISMMSFLFPIMVGIVLGDLVELAQVRIRLGKWALLPIFLFVLLFAAVIVVPLTITGTGYYSFSVRVIWLIFLLATPLFINRFSF